MRISLWIAACSAAMLLSAAAGAQERGGSEACMNDARTLCKDVQPGSGRIIKCLGDHRKDVSGECYKVLQRVEAHRAQDNSDAPPPPAQDEQGDSQGSGPED